MQRISQSNLQALDTYSVMTECYYRLLPEEPFEEKEETWCCEGCPYGRYSPCIGYCLQKILLEIKQKKAVREKEGDCLAG